MVEREDGNWIGGEGSMGVRVEMKAVWRVSLKGARGMESENVVTYLLLSRQG